nr:hypothetical protein CFP56_16012 [Quercus suber]
MFYGIWNMSALHLYNILDSNEPAGDLRRHHSKRPSSTTASTSHQRNKLPTLANPEPIAIEERGPLDCYTKATYLCPLRPREYPSNALSAQSRSSSFSREPLKLAPDPTPHDKIESSIDIDDDESLYSSPLYWFLTVWFPQQ